MPEIPRFYSSRLPPGTSGRVPVSPRMMAIEGEAWESVGKQIQETGLLAAKVFGAIANKNIEESAYEKVLKGTDIIKKEKSSIAQYIKEKEDWAGFDFDQYIENEYEILQKRLEEQGVTRAFSFEGGERTSKAVRNALQKEMIGDKEVLKTAALTKRLEWLKNSQNASFGSLFDQNVEDYVLTNDERIKERTKMEAIAVGTPYAMSLWDKFDETVVKKLSAQAMMEIIRGGGGADLVLQKDRYKNLSSETQLNLLKMGIAQDEKTEKKTQELTKEKSESRYTSILEDIDKGIDMESSIRSEGPNRGRILNLDHFEKALKANEVTQKSIREGDWGSNPNIEADIERKLYVAEPIITEKEIWGKSYPGGISRSKASKYSLDLRARNDHLKSIQRTEGNERRSDVNRLYGQAENYIERGLGISGMMLELYESIDPSQKKALRFAKDELWRRSAGGRGKEDPAFVADEILPRYQKMLHDEGLIEMKNIEAGLIYRDFDEIGKSPKLELDYKAGRVSKGTYDVQKQMLYERKRKMDLLGEVPNPLEQIKPGKKPKGPFK